jgi:oligopeptide transport system substrate-binding protein
MSLLFVRKAFPYFAALIALAALVYATSFGTMPRADFAFNNGTELKTIDPPLATGAPEGRVIDTLFEGLLRRLPDPNSPIGDSRTNTLFTPQFAMADAMQISSDGLTYTFHIRPTARWSDGSKLTAHDFVWSWQRMLHPETASEYAYQLHYIAGAKNYNEAKLEPNSEVEVELPNRTNATQLFPRGTVINGKLKEVIAPPEDSEEIKNSFEQKIFVVACNNEMRAFCQKPELSKKWYMGEHELESCLHVLPDFNTVGIKALNDEQLQVQLNYPTPYFAELVAFYPLYPVQRKNLEQFGVPDFTKPENLVCNGPYKIEFRRIRDRVRLIKNPHYWNSDSVALNTIDVMAVSSDLAALNMYETGQIDWLTNVSPLVIPEVKNREDYKTAPMWASYYYRVNCTRAPMNDKRVRRALCLTIERAKICETVTRAGETPTTGFVPSGMVGYSYPQGVDFNVTEARRLLAEAGFPGGSNFPKLEILYNTHETHQIIAEVIQEDWKKHLGIDIELRGVEWGTYLEAQTKLQYQVSRAAWTADYSDPNTYIDMFVTGGANNQTGWSNAEYDALVVKASQELNVEKRMEILATAEKILLEELPILPIYMYQQKHLVRPKFAGFHLNMQDFHPLQLFRLKAKSEEQP